MMVLDDSMVVLGALDDSMVVLNDNMVVLGALE